MEKRCGYRCTVRLFGAVLEYDDGRYSGYGGTTVFYRNNSADSVYPKLSVCGAVLKYCARHLQYAPRAFAAAQIMKLVSAVIFTLLGVGADALSVYLAAGKSCC